MNSFSQEEVTYRRKTLAFAAMLIGVARIAGTNFRYIAEPIDLYIYLFSNMTGVIFLAIAICSKNNLYSLNLLTKGFLVLIGINLSLLSILSSGLVSPLMAGLLGLPVLGSSLIGTSGTRWGSAIAGLALLTVYLAVEMGISTPDYANLANSETAFLVVQGILILTAYGIFLGIDNNQAEKHNKLLELNRALECEKSKAERALEIRSAFLANMSHEIRTPINGILGMASLLKDDVNTSEGENKINNIEASSNVLLKVINDILDFSKIDSGVIELELRDMDFKVVAADVVNVLQPLAAEKGIKIINLLDSEFPDSIQSDPTKISQVLFNLLGNAIKFSDGKNVELRAKIANKSKDTALLIVTVKDYGVGIPQAVQSKLFKPFSQVDSSTTRKYGGTGLGLVISRSIAQRLGGTISVESEAGLGSTFKFSCRVTQDDIPLAKTTGDDEIIQLDKNLAVGSLKILVAEDNEINREVTDGFLRKIGHYAEFASNGSEAIEKAHKHNYDLILMDCHMPEVDGYEATRVIVRELGLNRPFIAALTASAMKEDRERCRAAGMDDFLTKPLKIEQLRSLCTRVAAAVAV